jgi:oxygen-dependent protoporphyrinogen oxidase
VTAGTSFDLAVVGGGISGLAAAWEGVRRGANVVVLEAAGRAGGTLTTSPLGDLRVDEAADAFLARMPEALALCAELGIEGELVAPATGGAYVWIDGALRRLPSDQLLGVPTDLDAVAATGILSPAGVERARADLTAPDDRPAGDESVGDLVRRRLGDEVLDRLVAPLVGGIWAGDCDRLSLQVATPNLVAARARDASLLRGAAAVRADGLAAAAAAGERPVFLAPRGGMGRLSEALVDALGDRVRTGAPVTSLSRTSNGSGTAGGRWRLDPAGVTADAVVLALPAHRAAPLVADHAPPAAAALGAIDHATVALIGLVVPREAVGRDLDGSGFLVPRSAGRLVTACSWVSSKWAHLAGDGSSVVLRASVGHAADDRAATMADGELVAGVVADLRDLMALRGEPAATRVSRWPLSFPQPRPGHLDRVAALEADLAERAPRLAATGAWARGVGVPACIRGGRAAAGQVLATADA